MLKRLAVEIFLTVVLPSSSPSSIGSSPSLPVIRPTWNSEVFETWRRMFIRILCFTPWEKSWWIPSFCFTFNCSPAFVARTSSAQRFFMLNCDFPFAIYPRSHLWFAPWHPAKRLLAPVAPIWKKSSKDGKKSMETWSKEKCERG